MMSRRTRLERERERSRSPERSHSPSGQSAPRQTGVKAHCNRVVIRGLPADYGWARVKDLFREQVGFTGFLEMVESGTGVMEFRTVDGASKAIEIMDGYKLEDGSKMRVKEETHRERDEFQSRRPRNSRGNAGPMSYSNGGSSRFGSFSHTDSFMNERSSMRDPIGMGGMNMRMDLMNQDMRDSQYDDRQLLSPQILNYLGIDGPLTNQIFVWNLDYAVTWQKLKDIFRLAGNVLNVDVKESKEGTPRGNAVVTFEQPIEAVQAIAMLNNQQLMSRPMRIRMDRDARPGNASAEPFLGRRKSRREPGLPPNGRLPRDLGSVGMTLKEIANKMMMSNMSNSMNMMQNNASYGMMGAMGSFSNNGANNFSNMNTMGRGDMQNMGNYSRMTPMSQMTSMDMGGLRGGNDSGYMRQMAAVAMAAGYGGSNSGGGGIGGGAGPGFGAETRRLMLKNLPLSYGWKELKRLVRDAGEVRYADVLYDSNQHSTGIGTVRFATPSDAERAVRKLDGINIDGRVLRAELDFKD